MLKTAILIISKIIFAIKYLLNFRRPSISKFDCIDLVAGNRLLFLMAWEVRNANKIKLRPGLFKYKKSQGAVIVSLLPETREVSIYISNCWHSIKLKIPLKRMTLDRRSLELLTVDLKVIDNPRMHGLQSEIKNFWISFHLGHPHISNFSPRINFNPEFKYSKFNRHEP